MCPSTGPSRGAALKFFLLKKWIPNGAAWGETSLIAQIGIIKKFEGTKKLIRWSLLEF